MKTKLFFIAFTFFLISIGNAQDQALNLRFIEVTGSAEKEIEPDEIVFQIGIEEYWKEEFEKGKEYKDYVTKIPLREIESSLMIALMESGISENQILIKEVGRYWNRSGKDFKKNKAVELRLKDFNIVNKILANVDVKGISSMRIVDLKNKDIVKYREEVKVEAVKAAKRKASYLLEGVNEKLGKVISVVELDNNLAFNWQPRNSVSNTILPSSSNDNNQNFKKIKLKYEVKMKFEIE